MSMTKTLGGDRLGSGKKMRVDLHNYERSTHDLGYIWRSTMASGTLVPFLTEVALPGDTFDIDLNIDIQTHPTLGPLFGSFKVQADIFMSPIRLYQAKLHNNKLGIGMKMNSIFLPQLQMTAPSIDRTKQPDNQQINPSSIFSYLNIRALGQQIVPAESVRQFNALPYLTYWDIYKNYYANKQEEIGVVIHNETEAIIETLDSMMIQRDSMVIPEAPLNNVALFLRSDTILLGYTGTAPRTDQIIIHTDKGDFSLADAFENSEFTGGNGAVWNPKFRIETITNWRYISPNDAVAKEPTLQTFPLENIDNMREAILGAVTQNTPFIVDQDSPAPFGLAMKEAGGFYSQLVTQEGLAIKTYQSDLFNNWLSTEWIDGADGVSAVTAIDTSSGSFTIDTLNLSQKVYDMLNRVAVSGGTYDDWQDAVYTHNRYRKCETPMYMGGLSKELVFQQVVSTAASAAAEGQNEQPLGTLGGKGVMSGKHKGGKITIKVDEPSYIMGIISLTPRLDYSQGNKWDVNLKTMDDFHKPALDEIGFQDLIIDQMAGWGTALNGDNTPVYASAGKQPAWINYMTNVNQTRGNFAVQDNEMFMTLNRNYEMDEATGAVKDVTSYIDPVKFNQIFAQTARDAQNFWAQIGVDITARRKMSAKVMPNL